MEKCERQRQLIDLAYDGNEEAAHDLYLEFGILINVVRK